LLSEVSKNQFFRRGILILECQFSYNSFLPLDAKLIFSEAPFLVGKRLRQILPESPDVRCHVAARRALISDDIAVRMPRAVTARQRHVSVAVRTDRTRWYARSGFSSHRDETAGDGRKTLHSFVRQQTGS
jgi:hypothetical protein